MSSGLITALIFIGIILLTALIGGIAFGIYRLLHPKLKENRDTTNDLKEEMDRILVPIDDDQTSKEIQNYKEEDD